MVKMARAEVVGLTADLSGNIVPVKSVTVSDTVNKTIEVLDKIEQVEKEEDKVYWNKITTVEPKECG